MIEILQKYNPTILSLPHFNMILYTLRPRWIHFSDLRVDEILQNPNQHIIRKTYKKMMCCFLAYCRHPKAKANAIIDLAKGYRNHGFIDMTAIRLFF